MFGETQAPVAGGIRRITDTDDLTVLCNGSSGILTANAANEAVVGRPVQAEAKGPKSHDHACYGSGGLYILYQRPKSRSLRSKRVRVGVVWPIHSN